MAGKLASRVRGLSETQFREAYGTEAQCRAVVEKLRWPRGFVCPDCAGGEGKRLEHPTEDSVSGLPAPDVAHRRHHLPRHQTAADRLVLAIWLIATAKNGISSVELGRRLGIKQTNAWSHEAEDHAGHGRAR